MSMEIVLITVTMGSPRPLWVAPFSVLKRRKSGAVSIYAFSVFTVDVTTISSPCRLDSPAEMDHSLNYEQK